MHPDVELDVVTLKVDDPRVAVAAVEAGEIDASFRSVTDPAMLPRDVRMIHAFDSPLELLVGPRHPLASARTLTPPQLRRHRIWVPGIVPDSEWSEFYDQLATAFDLRIDAAGPNFGNEVLLDTLADSADVATLIAARDRYLWPVHYDLRRIPIVNPTLAYPISLLMRATDAHPALRGIVRPPELSDAPRRGRLATVLGAAPRGVDGTVADRSPTDRPPRSVGSP